LKYLDLASTKKEAERIIYESNVLVDGKVRKKTAFPVGFFDIVSLPKINAYWRTILVKGKLGFEQITKEKSHLKASKVIGKKILPGKKQQINLYDGKNFIYDKEIKINDSVIINLSQNKIVKLLPLKENTLAIVIGGKHKGKEGKIIRVEDKTVELETSEGVMKVSSENIFAFE
jgi:small subunit ribosomal protein S4e